MSLDLTPDDETAVHDFLAQREIGPAKESSHDRLEQVVNAFNPVLYENLSKILRRAAYPNLDPACLETPAVLLRNHLEIGTGGTCYSMAYSLAALLECAGVDCYLTLNDIRGQIANHAAVVAVVDGMTWLCDPGVQLRPPVLFSSDVSSSADNGYSLVHIVPTQVAGDFNVELQLSNDGPTIPFFLFHSRRVDEPTFRQVWLRSFTGPMMNTFHIFRHCGTQTRHLLYGIRMDKIPGHPEMKDPVTLDTLRAHVYEIWPEIPAGHMSAAWQALTARGASPVMTFENCMNAAGRSLR